MRQVTPDPNAAPDPYRLDDGWAKLPEGRKWGIPSAWTSIATGKSLWVFDRCGAKDMRRVERQADPEIRFVRQAADGIGAGMFVFRTACSWTATTISG